MKTFYCFRCNNSECEHGPCYYCARGEENPDPWIQTILPPDATACPQERDVSDGITPQWRRVNPPIRDNCFYEKKYDWLTEGLNDWLNENWDNVPKFLQDASCGFLIASQRYRHFKIIGLMGLFEGVENGRVDMEDAQKYVDKMTKLEIINDMLPDFFIAGMIFMAKQVLDGKFIPYSEEQEEQDDDNNDY